MIVCDLRVRRPTRAEQRLHSFVENPLTYFGLIEEVDLLLFEVDLHLSTAEDIEVIQWAAGFVLEFLEDLL